MSRQDPAIVGKSYDVVIVGGGFSGLYLLWRLRRMGLSAIAFEKGHTVGGTWYWNRYPGARCDAESLAYSFSFSPELEQEWRWTERYATQPEILKYAEHVADRFDLRRDIRFETVVETAHWNESEGIWRVTTDHGDDVTAPFCIMATGCLSKPMEPAIPGLHDFAGETYYSNRYPHEGVDLSGKRVGVIGTGSSAIQAIPVIAAECAHLTVFQRTPNFSVPAVNGPLDPEFERAFKANYRAHRENHKKALGSGFGDLCIKPHDAGPEWLDSADKSEEEIRAAVAKHWAAGGARIIGAVGDTLASERTNRIVADFVRDYIRQTVKDPATAERLCPTNHPIGSKRICVDIGYYDTYNLPHVRLVSIAENPIATITPTGLLLADGEAVDFDVLILATGFDAMTGALNAIDIRGVDGAALKEAWAEGPKTYLGLMMAGFPNLITITGPGSPSVLSNMMVSIEQHVDFTLDLIEAMRSKGQTRVEATPEAQAGWVEHVNEAAAMTLMPKAGSWYMGANIPGKPRVFMPYIGGVGTYREICDQVAAKGYEGFAFH